MSRSMSRFVYSIGILLLGILCLSACDSKSPAPEKMKSTHPGKLLAQQHCTSCHQLPEPWILPKDAWLFTMIWMGNYLGYEYREGPFERIVIPAYIPEKPLVTKAELRQVLDYYVSSAPDHPLPQDRKATVFQGFQRFTASFIDLPVKDNTPFVTMVKIDEAQQRIWTGLNSKTGPPSVMVLRPDGEVETVFEVDTQPVQVTFMEPFIYLTLIGDLEVDRRKGQIIRFEKSEDRFVANKLVENYYRTSDLQVQDLNGDGRLDLVVCAFGDYHQGRFSWFENTGDGKYIEHALINRSGALNAEIADFNGDARPDLMVLMTQGPNELWMFLNQGGGQFAAKKIFEQFSGFGYNHFCLADMNHDGHIDLITVNGNNMENPDPPLRNYHGIRIYLNDGRLNFSEKYFYPMHGATKAIPADFDQDGDVDIAAISYFPDWSQDRPEHFLYLQNQGSLRFQPMTLPETQSGRWLTMDAGDMDGDGDLDLLLGNAFSLDAIKVDYQPRVESKLSKSKPLLLLTNTVKQEPIPMGIGSKPEF